MKKYSLYLFDFDLTLFDTRESLIEVYNKTLKKFNKEVKEDEMDFLLGLNLYRMLEYKGIGKEHWLDYCKAFNQITDNDFDVIKKTKPFFDTLETLNYLDKNNLSFGVVTGGTTIRVKNVLSYYKFDPNKLKVYVGADNYRKPKPDGDPIILALELTGFLNRKDEVLYIGDAEQDIICAKNAGVDCVIVDRNTNKGNIKSLLEIFE